MGEYSKAWVAAIMAALGLLEQLFNWSPPGIDERWVTALVLILTPVLVYFVRNKPSV